MMIMKICKSSILTASVSFAVAFASVGAQAQPAKEVRVPRPSTTIITSQGGGSGSGGDWKGQSEVSDIGLGAMAGLGIHGGSAGFTLLGVASKSLSSDGFIPDINDGTNLEIQMGPFWVAGVTLFQYSAHLRWDFRKNEAWTFYALGGLGGYAGAGDFVIHPRVGVGVIHDMAKNFVFRGEFSHELVGVGVMFPLWF